jgi:hypothetical protein
MWARDVENDTVLTLERAVQGMGNRGNGDKDKKGINLKSGSFPSSVTFHTLLILPLKVIIIIIINRENSKI